MSMNVTNLVERNGAVNEWKRVISGVIEIVGDKVPAVKCNVVTLEECNDKEKTYVEKAKGKFESGDAMQNEIERIQRVSQNVSDSVKSWANVRIKILTEMKQVGSAGEL